MATHDMGDLALVVSQPVIGARRAGRGKVATLVLLASLSILVATVFLQMQVWAGGSTGPLLPPPSPGWDVVLAIVHFAWSAVGSLPWPDDRATGWLWLCSSSD